MLLSVTLAAMKGLGVNLKNTKMEETVRVHRDFTTGASPLTANELGKLAVKTLLE